MWKLTNWKRPKLTPITALCQWCIPFHLDCWKQEWGWSQTPVIGAQTRTWRTGDLLECESQNTQANQYWHLKINSLWSDKILDSFILIKQKLEFLCRINPIYQLLMLWNALHSYLVLIRFHYLNVKSGTKLHSLDWISWSIPFFLITKKDL